MFMGQEPWPLQPHPLWSSCDLNDVVTYPQRRQQNKLPYFPNSCNVMAEVAFPGPSVSVLPRSEIGQSNEVHRSFQSSPPYLGSSHLTANLIMKESWIAFSHGVGVKATPNPASGSGQKKFLIFDRSGNETRYIVSPFLPSPLQNEITVPKTSLDACNMRDSSVEKETISVMELINLEKVDENNIIDEESEMHEDTEEINALLYSDDSDEDDDSVDDDDDEVTSTGHSPVEIRGVHDNGGQVLEVASPDGSNKRQKLLDGGYKNSSVMDTTNLVKPDRTSNYIDVVESSCCAVREILSKDTDSILSACEKKLNIREMLKVLEKMVPGLEGKDPVLILDGAIDYLKSLRLKAKAVGVGYT